jgi:hypothetical protein
VAAGGSSACAGVNIVDGDALKIHGETISISEIGTQQAQEM